MLQIYKINILVLLFYPCQVVINKQYFHQLTYLLTQNIIYSNKSILILILHSQTQQLEIDLLQDEQNKNKSRRNLKILPHTKIKKKHSYQESLCLQIIPDQQILHLFIHALHLDKHAGIFIQLISQGSILIYLQLQSTFQTPILSINQPKNQKNKQINDITIIAICSWIQSLTKKQLMNKSSNKQQQQQQQQLHLYIRYWLIIKIQQNNNIS
ncbi:hypothetical protein TTHERM_001179782 (macronuclear) [Tetrahymena thermophila SB210]|uniref:Transmembrane protein n=1 Tax=Tetrahymena thermophila (strain SB210) TaxID=312017 RepID=W7X4U0_TETTS|nr:hypothetical protein TTHERM_001179782 [Tetrahymena thermophila SB210]EWS72442.1 hypothetical protein TTHERM_001179782 [Tetrahymena thermophila SB210]|eukprot:XP_012655022.1 hypothetical protein TTHERM_001179782 [Tetrahymena thermophila SB210]